MQFLGSVARHNSGVGRITLDLLPLGLLPGDCLLACAGMASYKDLAPGIVTTGWQELAEIYASDNFDANLSVNLKVMGAVPDDVVTADPAGGSFWYSDYYGSGLIVQAWRGVDSFNPIEALRIAKGYNSGQFVCPTVAPVTPGAVIVACGMSPADPGNGEIPSAPVGYGNVRAVAWKSDFRGAGIRMGMASKEWSGSGTETPGAWLCDWEVSESWAAASIVLRPAAP